MGKIIMKKVILITGASSGMGKITAEALIREGHTVYCGARNTDKMRDLEIRGGRIFRLDMSDVRSIEAVVDPIISAEGRIDVLWNNAGFGLYGPVEEIPIEKARYQFEVNLFGLARLTQQVLPHMRAQGDGLILNTSSMGGRMYTPLGAWYHASKHALEGWSDCLRLELKEFGIRVVLLEPGVIETGFVREVENQFPAESTSGPYKRIVQGFMNAIATGAARGSSPAVIAGTVKKIINKKNPRPRYLIGRMAKPMVVIRNLFGDRIFDKIMLSQTR